ncbi:MAG TPA: hypothetical protein RWO09_06130 [Ruminococcus sp.]
MFTALKSLEIRQYSCGLSPCNHKISLENPHIFPMNTSSEITKDLNKK